MLGKFERKMHRAIKKGDLDTVAWTVSVRADACACDGFGQSALHLAVAAGNLDIANVLLPHANPNAVNQFGRTPLMIAAEDGNADLVKLLCQRTDTTIKSRNGDTALTLAMSRSHSPSGVCMETVWPLLRLYTYKDVDGSTKNPLVVAAEHGIADVVRYLANPNDDSCTYRKARRRAAKIAAEAGNFECLGALLSPEDFDCTHLDKRDTWGWMLPKFAKKNWGRVFKTIERYQFHLDEIQEISAAAAPFPEEHQGGEEALPGEMAQPIISSHSSERLAGTAVVRSGRTRL